MGGLKRGTGFSHLGREAADMWNDILCDGEEVWKKKGVGEQCEV